MSPFRMESETVIYSYIGYCIGNLPPSQSFEL